VCLCSSSSISLSRDRSIVSSKLSIPPIVPRQRLGKSPLIVVRQRLGKSPLIIARQRLGKNPLIVAVQRLGRNVIAVTNTHATIEELLDASFSMLTVSYQGKYVISSPQNFLFILYLTSMFLSQSVEHLMV
jgi:hypothetical protein